MNRVKQAARKFSFAVAAWLLFISLSAHAQAPDWKTYRYAADGFGASFPSEPSAGRRNIPTEAGSFELHTYVAQENGVVLYVGVCDYGASLAGKDPDAVLQGAKTGALNSSAAHLLSEKAVAIGSAHGLSFESESDQAHFSARIYLVGATLYQTLVVMQLGKTYANTDRFLDSLQLFARTAN